MREYVFTGANCNTMASKLLEAFRGKQVDLYPDDELVNDLCRMSIVERPFGFKLQAPTSVTEGHADLAFAFSIALPHALELLKTSGGSWGGVINLTHTGRLLERLPRMRM